MALASCLYICSKKIINKSNTKYLNTENLNPMYFYIFFKCEKDIILMKSFLSTLANHSLSWNLTQTNKPEILCHSIFHFYIYEETFPKMYPSPITCVSQVAQNKWAQTQQAGFSLQVAVIPLHYLNSRASASADRRYAFVHFNQPAQIDQHPDFQPSEHVGALIHAVS